jgi:ubiquinone/menaquinone biosynthesis C-methylase UbiE
MHKYTESLLRRDYAGVPQPYQRYQETIRRHIKQGDVVLDIGCGHDAPDLQKLSHLPLSCRLIGLDLSELHAQNADSILLINASASQLCIKSKSIDLAICRSVMEHLRDPAEVFREVRRALKENGYFIFLTTTVRLNRQSVPISYCLVTG